MGTLANNSWTSHEVHCYSPPLLPCCCLYWSSSQPSGGSCSHPCGESCSHPCGESCSHPCGESCTPPCSSWVQPPPSWIQHCWTCQAWTCLHWIQQCPHTSACILWTSAQEWINTKKLWITHDTLR